MPSVARPGTARSRGCAAADGQHQRVELLQQVAGRQVLADDHAGLELHPLGRQLLQAAVQHALVQLEVRDAVAQQPADALGSFEQGHGVPLAPQALGGGQAGRAGADHGHPAAGVAPRRPRPDPALGEGPLADAQLQLPDGHRAGVDRQRAGALAGGGADPAGELGEVVGQLQAQPGLAPAAAVDRVVALRDQVAQGAAQRVAEGHAAVHAAGPLPGELLAGGGQGDLPPVADALFHAAVAGRQARVLQEAGGLAHQGNTSSVSFTVSDSFSSRLAQAPERRPVVERDHLDEQRQHLLPAAPGSRRRWGCR